MRVPDIEVVREAFDHCSWGNSYETALDWLEQLKGTDEIARKRLFSRIFLESQDGGFIKALFTEDQIRAYLEDFNRPLSRSHVERRRKVWRFLYLGEHSPIPELDWPAGR
jgi:hypothetical protein